MSVLEDPLHEAFAKAPAGGALPNDAHCSAGFVAHMGTLARDNISVVRLGAVTRTMNAGEGSKDLSIVREARHAIVDAAGLRSGLEPVQATHRVRIKSNFSCFSEARIMAADPVDA